mgnify:CR=1 FL=1
MKKLNRPKTSRAVLAGFAIAGLSGGLATSASAATIYSDDFTGGTNGDSLTGESPQTRPGSETYAGTDPSSTNDLSVFQYDANDRALAIGGADSPQASNFLPITLDGTRSYTLTATVYNPLAADSSSWISMGFADKNGVRDLSDGNSTDGSSNAFTSGFTDGRMSTLWRGNDNVRAFEGTGASGSLNLTGDDVAAGVSDELDLRTTIDFTAGSFGEAIFEYKDPTATGWTNLTTVTLDATKRSALLDNVAYVGYGANEAGVGVSEFELSSIPEPSVALLGGLGMLVLLRRRRY